MAQAILNRIASGDSNAVQECLKAYGGLIWSLARRMLRDSNDAEDVVQEIFVDIWKNAEKFDPSQSSETTFVAMIARRRIIDRIRYSARRLSPDSLDDVLAEPASRNDQTLQTSIEANEAAQIYSSTVFNYSSYTVAALLFLLLTIPLARFTDRLIERDRRRRLAGAAT